MTCVEFGELQGAYTLSRAGKSTEESVIDGPGCGFPHVPTSFPKDAYLILVMTET